MAVVMGKKGGWEGCGLGSWDWRFGGFWSVRVGKKGGGMGFCWGWVVGARAVEWGVGERGGGGEGVVGGGGVRWWGVAWVQVGGGKGG